MTTAIMIAASGMSNQEYIRRFTEMARKLAEKESHGKKAGPPFGAPAGTTRQEFIRRYVAVAKRIAESNVRAPSRCSKRSVSTILGLARLLAHHTMSYLCGESKCSILSNSSSAQI